MSVAVSAWATDLSLSGGRLHFPRVSGNEIVALGIPAGHQGEFPSSPEAAAEMSFKQTGSQVTEVPELIMPVGVHGPPQRAFWHLKLATPATTRTAKGNVSARATGVGLANIFQSGLTISVPDAEQPQAIDAPWIPAPEIGETEAAYNRRIAGSNRVAHLARRPDVPINLTFIAK